MADREQIASVNITSRASVSIPDPDPGFPSILSIRGEDFQNRPRDDYGFPPLEEGGCAASSSLIRRAWEATWARPF